MFNRAENLRPVGNSCEDFLTGEPGERQDICKILFRQYRHTGGMKTERITRRGVLSTVAPPTPATATPRQPCTKIFLAGDSVTFSFITPIIDVHLSIALLS